jgi:hypothetical protein
LSAALTVLAASLRDIAAQTNPTQRLLGSRRLSATRLRIADYQRYAANTLKCVQITTDHTITEYWNCVIQGHPQQGIDVFELDAEGRVVNQTVWLRPWPSVTILRDAAIAGQLPSLPADYWLLPAAPSKLS